MDHFAANDIAAFIASAGTPAEITTAGHFDATYTTKAISTTLLNKAKSAQFIDPTTGAVTSSTDEWFHFEMWQGFTSGSGAVYEVLNSAGTPVFRVFFASPTTVRLDYWDGAAYVNGGSTFTVTNNSLLVYDLHLVAGASGTADLYIGNSLALSLASMNAAVNNFAFIQLSGGAAGSGPHFSQLLVSDANTVGAKIGNLTPNSNSATNTAWTNDYTNIVKVGYNDATLISSSVLGDKESYGATDVALPTADYSISSVWFAVRARLNGSTPANIKPLLRIGGVNYAGAYNLAGLNAVSFAPSIGAFVDDPSTSTAWAGVTNVNAAEVGVQTAA